ncbi:MAG: hypothetical protein AAF439_07605 [Pseudomonadota bacterium]
MLIKAMCYDFFEVQRFIHSCAKIMAMADFTVGTPNHFTTC